MEFTMTARYITTAAVRALSAQLTERDHAVLKRVSDLRFVNGSQLTRLHFWDSDDEVANARAARRALLRLTRLDCLERLPRQVGGVRAGSAGFVYRLGLAGHGIAAELGWQPEGRRRRSQAPGTLFLSHALQVAELHTLLAEGDRSRRFELLALDAEPACWRSYGGTHGQRATLKPDSYVRLGIGEYEDSYFVEIDMGTEGSRALEGKLRQYVEYGATGQEQAERAVFPLTVWLTPDAERASIIEACIERLPHSVQDLFEVTPFADWDMTSGRKMVLGHHPK
jgi:hypothetical protein